ncbi:unnamed protein product [Lactuca virosa]|uniref:Uncharacterized protein n=1 Tax=Lactuca virosa TaxID=75947 RepID=A0AAU9LFC0_9ASTR|nr:unnamed protein product [Lactuca virosa]
MVKFGIAVDLFFCFSTVKAKEKKDGLQFTDSVPPIPSHTHRYHCSLSWPRRNGTGNRHGEIEGIDVINRNPRPPISTTMFREWNGERKREGEGWCNPKEIKNHYKERSTSTRSVATKGPRKGQLEQMIDDCLQAKAPVRFLKPKEREREAEREKMGLVSEDRKQEIANFKKNKNKAKDDNEQKSGIRFIGPEGLDLVSLGVVDADKIPKYELTVEDGRKLAKEYGRVLMRKHRARQAAETGLLMCKKEAIEALPEGLGLREAALVPDLTPFPRRGRAQLRGSSDEMRGKVVG